MSDKTLQRFYGRINAEGILKSILLGVAIGFGALALLGGAFWLFGWKAVWICLPVWAAVSACASYALYKRKFQPTTKYIARRIDDLGLHERILTMTELEGDDSYMAKRQREDALAALQTVREEFLKIGVSKPSIYTSSVAALLGIGVLIIAFLAAAGIIPSGKDLLYPNDGIYITYQLTYGVEGGEGSIQGENTQEIRMGEEASLVAAVAKDGWVFVRWSDGSTLPYRVDKPTENATYLALFVEINLGTVNGLDDDLPPDAPGDGESQNNNSMGGEEDSSSKDGKYETVNQIIDGKTYYGNVFGEAYNDAIGDLAEGNYSETEKGMGAGYFDYIEKGEMEEETEEDENLTP